MKALLVISALLALVHQYEAASSYIGCFRVERPNRHFSVSAGNYDPNNISPVTCMSACSKLKYSYAGLTSGRFCFCAHTLPNSSPEGGCTWTCTGSVSDTCGSDTHVDVYKAPVNVDGASVHPSSANIVQVFQPVTVSASMTSGPDPVVYSFDYGDGSGFTAPNATGMFSKTYSMPGEKMATVSISDPDNVVQPGKDSTIFLVQAPAKNVTVECPPVVVTTEEFFCNATVVSGSFMNFSLNYQGSEESFTIADATWHAAGPAVSEHGTYNNTPVTSRAYIMREAEFLQEGKLVAFEMIANATGNIDLLVLEPHCTTGGQEYCFKDNICKATGTCEASDTETCAGGEVFCGKSGHCTDNVNMNTSCTAHNRYISTSPSYKVKAIVPYTIASPGHQFHEIDLATDDISVSPGDVVGYIHNGGGSISSRPVTAGEEEDGHDPNVSPAIAHDYGNSFTASGVRHILRGIASKPSLVRIYHTYNSPGTYTITANASNQFISGYDTGTAVVVAQVGIDYAIISTELYVATNRSFYLAVLPHTGDNVTYTWDYGDGRAVVVTTERNFSASYANRGVYNITVQAENLLSLKTNTTIIHVQDTITDLLVTSTPCPTGNSTFTLTMATGSDYYCTWDFEGVQQVTDSIQTPPSGLPFQYPLTPAKVYTVQVTCANNVSSAQYTFSHTVQDVITGLDLEKKGAEGSQSFQLKFLMATGTNATTSITFDSYSVNVATYDEALLKGTSVPVAGQPVGVYLVTLQAENLVSNVEVNFTFVVETKITGEDCNSTGTDIMVGDAVDFWAWITAGSSVEILWDYGDSTPNDSYSVGPGVGWPGGSQKKSHVFASPGVFTVKTYIYNNLNSKVCNITVKAFNRVENVTLTSNSPQPFLKTGSEVTFWFIFNGDVPTEASVDCTYGDQQTLPTTLYNNGDTYRNTYKLKGTYTVRCNMSNKVNFQILTHTIHIIVPVTNMRLHVTPEHAAPNQLVNVGVSMDQGNNVRLYFSGGDPTGTWDEEKMRTGTHPLDKDTFNHTYSTPGTYEMTVMAQNGLGNTTITYYIVIQHPVTGQFSVTSDSPKRLTVSSTVTAIMTFTGSQFPDDPYIRIDWADGTVEGPTPFTNAGFPKTYPHDYTAAGTGSHKANVTVFNLASSETFMIDAGVYADITTLNSQVRYKPEVPVGGPPQPGFGPLQEWFPITRSVWFYMAVTGTVEEYNFVANSSSSVKICDFNNTNELEVDFPEPGTYDVSITARNPFTTQTWTVSIMVLDGITGISVNDQQIVTQAGQSKSFDLNFATLGPDACLTVEWGDGLSSNFGSHSDCNPVGPPLTNPMTISHVYDTEQQYEAKFLGVSKIGSANTTFTFSVSSSQCKSPLISIRDVAPKFNLPTKRFRKDNFIVFGKTNLNCATTLVNEKYWRVYSINPSNGDLIQEVNMDDVPTRYNAELSIKRRSLPVGLYKFEYSVQMTRSEFPRNDLFSAKTETFIEIKNSPLVPVIVKGGITRMTVGSNQEIDLEPIKYSLDPDLDPSADQNFDKFNWFCRRIDENILKDETGSLSTVNASAPLTVAQLSALTVDQGGCFRQGPGAVIVPGNGGKLTFNTKNMLENETYEFLVEAVKGDRKAKVVLQMDIIHGEPPLISIACENGSICHQREDGQDINPSNRLGVVATCLKGCSADIQYEWRLDYKGFSWDHWIEYPNIENYTSGIDALRSTKVTFARSVFKRDWYRVRLTATKPGYPVGEAYMNLAVNKAPEGGNCTVNSTVGVAYKDIWNLRCHGWVDMDGIAMYQFYAKYKDEPMERHLSFGVDNSINTVLPLGPFYDDFNMTLMARIVDERGAATEVTIAEVKATEPSQASLKKEMDAILSTDQNDIAKVAAQGDILKTNLEYLKMATVLNTARKNSQEAYFDTDVVRDTSSIGYGPRYTNKQNTVVTGSGLNMTAEEKEEAIEQVRDTRSRYREEMAEALANLTKPDIASIQLCASTIGVLTAPAEEMTRKAQKTLSKSLKDMANTLFDLAEETPIEEIKRTASNLFDSVGNLFEGAMITLEHGTIADVDRAEKGPFAIYETNLESDRLKLMSMDYTKALKEFRKETNMYQQRDTTASSIMPDLTGALDTITDAVLRNTIPGEEKMQMVTPKLSISLGMGTADDILNRTLTEGDSEAVIPDYCSLTNGQANCSNQNVVSLRTMATPVNPYSYLAAKRGIPNLSGTMSLDVYDENKKVMDINESQEPIVISLPRKNIESPVPVSYQPLRLNNSQSHLSYISMNITSYGSSFHARLVPDDPNTKLLVLVRFDKFPKLNGTDRGWDFMQVIPDSSLPNGTCGVTKDPYTVFMDNFMIKNRTGKVFFGLRSVTPDEYTAYQNGSVPGVPTPYTGFINTNITTSFFSSGCYFVPNASPDSQFDSKGCQVCSETTWNMTYCQCSHLTTFAGGFAVQPNAIDFDFVFSNMDFAKNPTLYVTLIVISVIYLCFAIWARHQDKKDVEKLGVTPLADNDPNDKYMYEVVFFTGGRKCAGTDSVVQFILSGELDETDVRVLSDSKRKILRRGATDSFLMATPRPLGALNYCRVWHDNSGKGKFASWYLKHIVVHDLQTKERHYFICNRWFAVEEDDGQVDRTIPVAGPEQLSSFAHLFGQQTSKNLGDEHLWFSVITRPPSSRFTRLQRVSCCLSLLFTSMLANGMFYGVVQDSTAPGQQAYQLGPFALSMEQIYVGIICNLVVFPVNFLIVLLFRKARPRYKQPNRIQEALRKHGIKSGNTLTGIKLESHHKSSDKQGLVNNESTYKGDHRPISAISRPGSALTAELEDRTKVKKKKKGWALPWWFTIVSWVLLWLTVLTSGAFVLFYGVSFGDEKCRKWISSMVMSFITSIFLTQPLKVLLTALVFSLIFKKPNMEEDLEPQDEDSELSPDEEFLHFRHHEGFAAATQPRKMAYRPPDPEQLKQAREQRLKELQMYDILREILFYAMFLWILLVISYSYRDPNSYFLKKGLQDLFINNDAPFVDGFDNDFTKVDNIDRFWNWTEQVLLSSLRAQKWYNGAPPLGQRGFVGDRANRIMGYATIRQLRIRKGLCELRGSMVLAAKECNVPYNFWDEDTDDYGISWSPLNVSGAWNNSAFEYKYRTGSELDSYPYWGLHGFYSGGGYVAELRSSLSQMKKRISELRSQKWVDKYTRAIFIEFTIYNANVNLFGISTLLAEVLNSGGIFTSFRFEPVNLLSYFTGAMLFQIICEVIYLFFILFFIIKEARNMAKQGKEYFKQFWSWVELCIIGFSVSGTVIYFYRLLVTKVLVERFRESHGNDYMKFQYVGAWHELLMIMVAWLVFLATLKFLKLLRFNKKIGMMAATLHYGSVHLIAFGFMFAIMFSAFAQFFYLIYHIEMLSFSTIVRSAETCMQMMLGRFNFYAMKTAQPLLGPLFFFIYTVVVAYILINMFLTIINESFSMVRADLAKQSNEHEMVEFMLRRFQIWTGLGYKPSAQQPNKHAGGLKPAFPVEVDDFPDKVERLLNCISKVYFDRDRFETIFDSSNPNNKEIMKKLMKGHTDANQERIRQQVLRLNQQRLMADIDC